MGEETASGRSAAASASAGRRSAVEAWFDWTGVLGFGEGGFPAETAVENRNDPVADGLSVWDADDWPGAANDVPVAGASANTDRFGASPGPAPALKDDRGGDAIGLSASADWLGNDPVGGTSGRTALPASDAGLAALVSQWASFGDVSGDLLSRAAAAQEAWTAPDWAARSAEPVYAAEAVVADQPGSDAQSRWAAAPAGYAPDAQASPFGRTATPYGLNGAGLDYAADATWRG